MSDFLDLLRQPHILLLLRLVLGALLLIAGVTKLLDRAAFYDAVTEYDVLPSKMTRPFVSGNRPQIRFTIVLFPEPFGPIRPSTSPAATFKLTPSTARTPPKFLARLSSSSTARRLS